MNWYSGKAEFLQTDVLKSCMVNAVLSDFNVVYSTEIIAGDTLSASLPCPVFFT